MTSPLRPDEGTEGPSDSDVERSKELALARLSERGLDVDEWASSEQLVDLLDAVEAFEAAARALGSDSFTNTLDSTRPDDPDCVLPHPRADESIDSYISRVRRQADLLTGRAR